MSAPSLLAWAWAWAGITALIMLSAFVALRARGIADVIWRSTGVGVRLSPTEADAAAESIDEAARAMLQALTGEPEVPPTPIPFGHAEPHGVYADDQEPVSAEMASLIGKVAGAMITRIAADVHRYRATLAAIANTDGDPMCLISVTIAVEEGTAGKLAARPDFDRDTGEPDRVTWWGALIPDGQREAMMAEAMAQLRAQGNGDVEAPEGPQRWVRGVLRVRDREITVEVNSRQRLTRLLDILRKVGANPVVTSEKRIDPAMDVAWPVGQRASQGGAAAAAEGWERFWLDEKVPALLGRTPRQAAHGREAALPGGTAAAIRVRGGPPRRRWQDWGRYRLAAQATRHAKRSRRLNAWTTGRRS